MTSFMVCTTLSGSDLLYTTHFFTDYSSQLYSKTDCTIRVFVMCYKKKVIVVSDNFRKPGVPPPTVSHGPAVSFKQETVTIKLHITITLISATINAA